MAEDTRQSGFPDGERELERRRLERVCEPGDELESVERREPVLLPKLSYGLPLTRGRFALYALDPAAEHIPYFIEFFRKKNIFLIVERLHIPENFQEELREIEPHIRFSEIGQFLFFAQVACDEQ